MFNMLWFVICMLSICAPMALSNRAGNLSNTNSENLSIVKQLGESNATLSGNFSYGAEKVTLSTSLSTSNQRILIQQNRNYNDMSVTNTYDVLSWLPKPQKPHSTANLTILPILAILAFLIMLCLKGCTWFRESTKDKDRDSDGDHSFMILHEGDKDYNDIDFRSDLSTPYDTYNSYMSFLRRNNNYDTVNSIRSLQGSRNYDTVTSYRSLLQQRLENQDSVTSYQAFLKRVKAMKDVEVQVELLDEKVFDRNGSFRHSRRKQRDSSSPNGRSKPFSSNGVVLDSLLEVNSPGAVAKEKHDVGVGDCVVSEESPNSVSRRHYRKSPQRDKRSNSPVKHLCQSSPVRGTDSPKEIHNQTNSSAPCSKEASTNSSQKETSASHQTRQPVPRFRVSFVTDDKSDVKSSSLQPDKDKLSVPSSIVSDSDKVQSGPEDSASKDTEVP